MFGSMMCTSSRLWGRLQTPKISNAAMAGIPNLLALSDKLNQLTIGQSQPSCLAINMQQSRPINMSAMLEKTLRWYHLLGRPMRRKLPLKSKIRGNLATSGVVLKCVIRKPKKPNSANRKCCVVRLKNGKTVTAFIPGIGHNLQEHSQVLIKGHRHQDLSHVLTAVIRGALDCAPIKRNKKSLQDK